MTQADQPLRLVKILMPADAVRQMDQTILAADGAYQGRADFITEAVRDRVAEEAAMRSASVIRDARHRKIIPGADAALPNFVAFASWAERVPLTAPGRPSAATSFGLHNRDLPTLWAFDQLARAAVDREGPVTWAEFIAQIGRLSVTVGEWFRLRDLARGRGIQVGTGFPKPGAKQAQSVDRFIGAMVGSLRRGDGPLFDLSLAVPADQTLLPTTAGIEALKAMAAGGLGTELPQPEPAFRAWWTHLLAWAPAERAAWHAIVRAVATAPTREALVATFPEWPGSTADTNTTGFISRSREWGLVEPELIDSRYRLTALGELIAAEE